ncbi:MAG: 3-dehydroquinate synthase [Alphaproteobacteria bacterium]|nr:MAG: 3-dehydroquinate synthase [Alphaproteobacteria bacterium]TAF14288.1 MAG: 3-dehydroquinate synthase [Alphaproteobacteria bacterium]TAF38749.1 MAG: 3-dehydroquinate synthase [Alphaproteobacteria bacterium]TAF76476.1 MAG: 3-dehydroquinate synthase [Alphaproteobacteria bacterium]
MNTPSSYHVCIPSASYPIFFGEHLLEDLHRFIAPYVRGKKIFLVTDSHVAPLYQEMVEQALRLGGYEIASFVVEAGEGAKSFASFAHLCEAMLKHQPDRRTTIVALGGGVVGDLTGFVASVLLRGVPFIQMPTTLLAQVDSSVGGKTGINAQSGKNLIGSFYQPQCVVMDRATLRTLPRRELVAGYAEVLKYGLLGDAEFYQRLLHEGQEVLATLAEPSMPQHAWAEEMIMHCCRMKATIVAEDEKEQGRRALLNLGHTFAHAIEHKGGYDGRILHGEAVALGCLMALRLSNMTIEECATFRQHMEALGMATSLSALCSNIAWDAQELTALCYHDKKAHSGGLTFIALNHIGDACVRHDVMPQQVQSIFAEFI